MYSFAAFCTDAFFILAWLFPLLVTLGYQRTTVQSRLKEIMGVFFSGDLEQATWCEVLKRGPKEHPAWQYAERFGFNTNEDLKKPIREQFLRYQSSTHYILPMLLILLFSACAMWVCREWVHGKWFPSPVAASETPKAKDAPGTGESRKAGGETEKESFPRTVDPSVLMALAGAYVWAVWEILSRSHSGDLTPEELYDVAFRWATAVPIGYAFSLLAGPSFQPAFAFGASAFPLKDVQRFMRQWNLKKILEGTVTPAPRPEERHLGKAIDGVGEATLARLEELGIVTVLDMAYGDPVRTMIKTGFPLYNVVDWLDQSVLTLYAGDRRKDFASGGLRCSIDVCEFVDMHLWDRAARKERSAPDNEAIDKLAEVLKMPRVLMVDLLYRIRFDPQVELLYNLWYSSGASKMLGGTVS